MLLAVLEKRAGLALAGQDVYVSTVGGVKLTEPAADLAIALAIASAVRNRPIAHTVAAFGEISLAGEIRPVSAAKQRTAEGARLGFTTRMDAASGSITAAVSQALATGVSSRDAELDRAF
jgi:DNA repair protein RadA/Sms